MELNYTAIACNNAMHAVDYRLKRQISQSSSESGCVDKNRHRKEDCVMFFFRYLVTKYLSATQGAHVFEVTNVCTLASGQRLHNVRVRQLYSKSKLPRIVVYFVSSLHDRHKKEMVTHRATGRVHCQALRK